MAQGKSTVADTGMGKGAYPYWPCKIGHEKDTCTYKIHISAHYVHFLDPLLAYCWADLSKAERSHGNKSTVIVKKSLGNKDLNDLVTIWWPCVTHLECLFESACSIWCAAQLAKWCRGTMTRVCRLTNQQWCSLHLKSAQLVQFINSST